MTYSVATGAGARGVYHIILRHGAMRKQEKQSSGDFFPLCTLYHLIAEHCRQLCHFQLNLGPFPYNCLVQVTTPHASPRTCRE